MMNRKLNLKNQRGKTHIFHGKKQREMICEGKQEGTVAKELGVQAEKSKGMLLEED